MKKYIARLTDAERASLKELVSKGRTQAYKIKHANILLQVDAEGPNWTDERTAKVLRCHANTVRNVRQRLVEQGLEAALERKKQDRPSRKRIIDGEAEARLVKIACGQAPQGRAKWTMALLADQLVALRIVDKVSEDTVRRTLKKTNSSLTCANAG